MTLICVVNVYIIRYPYHQQTGPEVEIQGYKFFHKDRKGRKGRVALYVRDTLQCSVNNVIKIDGRVESIWVEVKEATRKNFRCV